MDKTSGRSFWTTPYLSSTNEAATKWERPKFIMKNIDPVREHVNTKPQTFDKKNDRLSSGKSLSSLGIRQLPPQKIDDRLLL